MLDDIKGLLEDKDIDDTLGDHWKDDLTKIQKFKRCLRNLVSQNNKDLKKFDYNKVVANLPLKKGFEGKSLNTLSYKTPKFRLKS